MIKSRRMTGAGQVARMGKKQNAYRLLEGNPKGKKPQRRHTRTWKTILKWILKK
jgi:hypothetical protein